MTVTIAKPSVTFTGLSTDTKPTTGFGPESKFYETDTNNSFEWDGDSWNQLPSAVHGALSVTTSDHMKTFSEEYATSSGALVGAGNIIAPASGKRISVYSVRMKTDSTAGLINADFATSGIKIIREYPAKSTPIDPSDMHMIGAANEPVNLTASGLSNGSKVFVIINYIEHES